MVVTTMQKAARAKKNEIESKMESLWTFLVAFSLLHEQITEEYTNLIMGFMRPFFGDNRAAADMMENGVEIAVGLLVVGLLVAYLLPVAIDEIVGVETSSWGDAESSLFNLLPLFFVLAPLLFVVTWAMKNT